MSSNNRVEVVSSNNRSNNRVEAVSSSNSVVVAARAAAEGVPAMGPK